MIRAGLVLTVLLAGETMATELYRYHDSAGILVTADTNLSATLFATKFLRNAFTDTDIKIVCFGKFRKKNRQSGRFFLSFFFCQKKPLQKITSASFDSIGHKRFLCIQNHNFLHRFITERGYKMSRTPVHFD